MTNTLTLTLAELRSVAALALFTASPRDNSPVLECVSLTVTAGAAGGETVTAYATDRYRAVELVIHHAEEQHSDPGVYFVPGKLLTAFATATRATKFGIMPVTIVQDGGQGDVTISGTGVTLSGTVPADTKPFPLIARLFPVDDDAFGELEGLAFNPALLAPVSKLSHPFAVSSPAWDVRFMRGSGEGKTGPMVLELPMLKGAHPDDRLRVLIQPHIRLPLRERAN